MNITTPPAAAGLVPTVYRPQHNIRVLTATSLFDGHDAAINNEDIFDPLLDAVPRCSLGQITNLLFEVGGQYRRNL